MNDNDEILELIQADNPAALEKIYDLYGRALFGYMLTIVRSKSDAEDCLQNLFIRIAEKKDQIVGKKYLKAYLMTMARNEAISHLRAQKRSIVDFTSEEPLLASCDSNHELPVAELSAALFALPLEQREVISLKIFEQMTFESISELLEISPNTLASRYRYGIARMKQMMQEVV